MKTTKGKRDEMLDNPWDGMVPVSFARDIADDLDEMEADKLFAEGERDAARHDLAVAQDHLKAENNYAVEVERERDALRAQVATLREALTEVRVIMTSEDGDVVDVVVVLERPSVVAALDATKPKDGGT